MITQLEQGHIDTMHAMRKLKTNLRSGIMAVEYPAPGDGVIAAKRDMEYIKFLKKLARNKVACYVLPKRRPYSHFALKRAENLKFRNKYFT